MDVRISNLGDELCSEGVDNGASMSFLNDDDEIVRSEVDFVYKADSLGLAHMALIRTLRQHLAQPRLLDFQVQAVANIVYRPSLVKVNKIVVRTMLRGGAKTFSLHEKVRFGLSDIGATVVNDLMPGSGKSLVTMLSSIYFAINRAQDVVNREEILLREQRPMNWSSRFGVSDSKRPYTNSVIVMTSDKVVAQWEAAANQACEILHVKNIHINRNPRNLQGDSENVSVNLFTSVATLRQCFPEDNGFVPCVVVDEYVVKAMHNVVTRNAEVTPIYGRLILVSADAGNTADILVGSRRTSLIRATVANGEVDSSSLRSDVMLSAALMVCGVLSTQARDGAHNFLLLGFNGTRVEKFTIKYDNPVWGAYDGVSHVMPAQLEELGIKGLSAVETSEELLERIRDRKLEPVDEVDHERLVTLGYRLEKFLADDDDCPVCLDKLQKSQHICMLCPCWHFVCKTCTKLCLKARETCPVCREDIDGIMNLRTAISPSPVHKKPTSESFDGFLEACLPESPGSVEACSAILEASVNALLAEIENPVLRLLLIAPSTKFSNELKKRLRGKHRDLVNIVQLKVEGNKRKRTSMGYEEQLEWFKGEEKDQIKVLCTHENVHLTGDLFGLDLNHVDSICHVGGELTGRRLGRVARVQRAVGNPSPTLRIFSLMAC